MPFGEASGTPSANLIRLLAPKQRDEGLSAANRRLCAEAVPSGRAAVWPGTGLGFRPGGGQC